MKIVFLEPLEVDIKSFLVHPKFKEHEIIIYDERTNDKQGIIKRIKNADIIISDNTPLDEEILSSDKKLRALFIAFTGLDHIPLDYLEKNNIEVYNAAGYSTDATSQLTLMFILMGLRKFNELSYKNKVIGRELKNLKIGFIGMGKIAQATLKLLAPFKDIEILYNATHEHDEIHGCRFVDRKTIYEECDIISLHVPANEETKNLVSKKEFAMIRDDAILINTARGSLVNKRYLVEKLNNCPNFLYMSDVFEKEPPLDDKYELIKHQNVVITPHVGFYTKEAMNKRAQIIVDKLTSYLLFLRWFNR